MAMALAMCGAPAGAQSGTDLEWAARYILSEPEGDAAQACAEHLERADLLNAPDLLRGAAMCHTAQKLVEGNFFLLVGQSRFTVDATTLMPVDREGAGRMVSLYGFIYYRAGGLGADQVYADPEAFARLLALYDGWRGSPPAQYDPGWSVAIKPNLAGYAAAIIEQKAQRREDMLRMAALMSDPEYRALDDAFDSLSERTGGSFEHGSPEWLDYNRLTAAMEDRAAALGFPSRRSPPAEAGARPELPPHPKADETVLEEHDDDTVRRCARSARFGALVSDETVEAVLVTSDPEWGTIYRADLVGISGKVTRYACADGFTVQRPLELGDDNLPRLSAGRSER